MRTPAVSLAVSLLGTSLLAADFITYEQFGAKGDGTTDDLPAIVAAHAAANERGLPVRARDDATYYLRGDGLTAVVKTSVDFGDASFVIDDTLITNSERYVFQIASKYAPYEVKGVKALTRGMTNVGVTLPGRALVRFEDRSNRQYRRTGNRFMTNSGDPQRELLVVGADGMLDPRTEVVQDMAAVTKATAWPIDEDVLTVAGGRFTTLSTAELAPPDKYRYYYRGFGICRSNVRMSNVRHEVVRQVPKCLPYEGFVILRQAADVTLSNCVFFAHRMTTHGTYDLTMRDCVRLRFVNCREATDITEGGKRDWWAFGSNYCRDTELDGCTFGRFDAHCGTHNVTIRNSRLCVIAVSGSGRFLVENTRTEAYWYMAGFRGDYGSNWDGDFIVRNCTVRTREGDCGYFISAANDGSHDYGYPCHLARQIVVDGLTVENGAPGKGAKPFTWFLFEGGKAPRPDAPYPYHLPEGITVRNVRCTNGLKPRIADDPSLFKDVPFVLQ